MDKAMEQRIREIVREEIAAHKEQLTGEEIANALSQYLKQQRKARGETSVFDTPEELE